MTDQQNKRYHELLKKEQENDGFDTKEEAQEYSELRRASWGPNLVSLGVSQDEKTGKWNAFFNVWD